MVVDNSGFLKVNSDIFLDSGNSIGLDANTNIQFGGSSNLHLNASGQDMTFNIDTDNNSTTSAFRWLKNATDG